jgi:NAD(P)-dependent dehydrogenase (short-subunit alcohol dehydrogenase family)
VIVGDESPGFDQVTRTLFRFAEAADLVPAARLLMAPEGGYVTGQVLIVDGGMTA